MNKTTNGLAFELTEEMMLDFAGHTYFDRGLDYYHRGKVVELEQKNEAVHARVSGTKSYGVMLKPEETGSLFWSCTCPLGERGDFCKHAVAAGLAWIHQQVSAAKQATTDPEEERIKQYLEQQPTSILAKMLLRQAVEDEHLYRKLLMKADRFLSTEIDLKLFKKRLRSAIGMGRFIDYRSMRFYIPGVRDAVAEIQELLDDGHAAEALELCEYALKLVEKAMLHADDSDGMLGGEMRNLEKIHLEACLVIKPSPIKLAAKLFKWEMTTDWDTFYGAVDNYTDLLGDKGLAKYKALAKKEWDELPALGPGEWKGSHTSKRFRLTKIMEGLAKASGDLEALVEVKKKDLSMPGHYLDIASLYAENHKRDEAIHWAEAGHEIFTTEHGIGKLAEFLIEQYAHAQRHDDAIALAWQRYQASPDLTWYRHLHDCAAPMDAWHEWREKALDLARKDIGEQRHPWSQGASLLVELFIWEGDLEAAYTEAKNNGCPGHLWTTLARKFENSNPARAAEIYAFLVPCIIKQGNNKAYDQALRHMLVIEDLLKRTGKADSFAGFVEGIKTEFKIKRNMMKLIAKQGW